MGIIRVGGFILIVFLFFPIRRQEHILHFVIKYVMRSVSIILDIIDDKNIAYNISKANKNDFLDDKNIAYNISKANKNDFQFLIMNHRKQKPTIKSRILILY